MISTTLILKSQSYRIRLSLEKWKLWMLSKHQWHHSSQKASISWINSQFYATSSKLILIKTKNLKQQSLISTTLILKSQSYRVRLSLEKWKLWMLSKHQWHHSSQKASIFMNKFPIWRAMSKTAFWRRVFTLVVLGTEYLFFCWKNSLILQNN